MPQPLSSITSDASITFGPDSVSHHPTLALGIAPVINGWSYLEEKLGKTLAIILGTSAEAGVAMYTSLISSKAQNAALQAAAKISLKDSNLLLFQSILSLTSSIAKERNRIAHGIWASSPSMPDSLLTGTECSNQIHDQGRTIANAASSDAG